jgi:hypothetical protein
MQSARGAAHCRARGREVGCRVPQRFRTRFDSAMQPSILLVPLRAGAHPNRDDGVCAMEMVAWLAGEPHSDEPSCACPVIGALVRACNDAMGDDARNRYLRPLVPTLVGTRATAAVERERGLQVVDAMVRVLLPRKLRREQRADEAELLAGLPPITRLEHVRTALRAVEHFALRAHAVKWVLQRAADGVPAARYVAGAVQLARSLHDGDTWAAIAALVERMAATTAPVPAAAPAAGTATFARA